MLTSISSMELFIILLRTGFSEVEMENCSMSLVLDELMTLSRRRNQLSIGTSAEEMTTPWRLTRAVPVRMDESKYNICY